MNPLPAIGRLALIGVLAVCATSLRAQLETDRSRLDTERLRLTRSQRSAVRSISGIDLTGRLIDSIPPQADRLVVCGLRSQTLRDDIDHWTAVRALLPEPSRVEIVAYCDGPNCRDSLRQSANKPAFTVIAYGEVASSQAVATADDRGECLLLDRNLRLVRPVQWRISKRQPFDVAREIVQ